MNKPVQILMVEDNPGDVRIMAEALREVGLATQLIVAQDGEQALARLQGSEPLPDLILLDLNLPKKPGHEVLAAIKSDPRLSLIPVVILSSSRAGEDILKSYQLRANSYISKPAGLENFVQIARAIGSFWLSAATLPSRIL